MKRKERNDNVPPLVQVVTVKPTSTIVSYIIRKKAQCVDTEPLSFCFDETKE